jgi:hypothetical protein
VEIENETFDTLKIRVTTLSTIMAMEKRIYPIPCHVDDDCFFGGPDSATRKHSFYQISLGKRDQNWVMGGFESHYQGY